MTDNAADKIKEAFKGLPGDRKTVIKILSVVVVVGGVESVEMCFFV